MSRAATQLLSTRSTLGSRHFYLGRASTRQTRPASGQPLAKTGLTAKPRAPHRRPEMAANSTITYSDVASAGLPSAPERHGAADFAESAMNSAMSSRYPSRAGSPNPYHQPNTGQDEEKVYVLTLNLTPSIAVPLEEMRQEFFPKHLNRTPAHITLFHALPHSQIDTIDADLTRVTGRTKPYHISTGKPYRLRKGVAVLLGTGDEQSQNLREELREKWFQWLTMQDSRSRGWQPHWTVMNKVDEDKKVQSAFNTLRRILFEEVHRGKVLGFDLWIYNAGRWDHEKEYRFQGHEKKKAPKGSGVAESDGHAEQKAESREKPAERGEGTEKKAGGRWGDMWKTVTLAKKNPRQDVERR